MPIAFNGNLSITFFSNSADIGQQNTWKNSLRVAGKNRNSGRIELRTVRKSATCLQRSAGDASIDASEENGVVVGTRTDVILSEHVTTINVQLAALLRVLVD